VKKKRTSSKLSASKNRRSKTPVGKKSKAAGKPVGVSLHIGLNAVNPGDYSGWSGPLTACEADARDMAAIAKAQGITSTMLLTKDATRAETLAAIRAAAKQLKAGDLFFLTYSGHGGQVDDVSGEEEDKLDETWCLYDGQLIDDELYLELSRFGKDVRVLVLSDSCHSGTVTRAAPPPGRARAMPPDIAKKVYADHKVFYDRLQRQVMKESKGTPTDPDAALAHVAVSGRLMNIAAKAKAAILLISGCQDNQTSMDGDHNGAFTEQVLKVWNNGAYQGNYTKFHDAVKARLPSTQTPNLFELGPATTFATQRPFTL